ncbi:hypothetical protein PJP07_30305, partial [Mycobacterium kansasii]
TPITLVTFIGTSYVRFFIVKPNLIGKSKLRDRGSTEKLIQAREREDQASQDELQKKIVSDK